MSGVAARRWAAFRANRPALVALCVFCAMLFVSLFAELAANDCPLLIRYENSWKFPLAATYTEEDFGGDLPLPANYHDPWLCENLEKNGFVIWPPIRFSHQTINYYRSGVFPLPPGEGNILGTDDQGRDVLARLIYGFRLSVLFGLVLAAFSSAVGITAGALQGFMGGKVDLLGQRFMEIWSGVPVLYLLIIISASIRMTFWLLLLVMLLFSWMSLVHVVRAECLRVRNLEYVLAARALGVSNMRILFRHVLPNALVAVFSMLPFQVNGSIVALTSLDFLGFGLPPGYPSLGEMIAQGKNNLYAPWIGISIFVLLTCMLSMLVLIGEGVRDAFDPSVYLQSSEEKDRKEDRDRGKAREKGTKREEANGGGDSSSEAADTSAQEAEPARASRTAENPEVLPAGQNRTPAEASPPDTGQTANTPLLEIRDLHVAFPGHGGLSEVVHGVSLSLQPSEIAAIVGDSGSGKTLTMRSILGLLPSGAVRTSGHILFGGRDLRTAREAEMRRLRGKDIGMVFQDPLAGLNPLHRVQKQLEEAMKAHGIRDAAQIRARLHELMKMVALDDADRILRAYPHQLSGGQRQRVLLAMALANSPRLLIADEPTTALDAVVQLEILKLISELRRKLGMAVLLVTHDLSIVSHFADTVHVMQHGRIVEHGPAEEIFSHPQHPYTRTLLEVPQFAAPPATEQERVLEADNITVSYPVAKNLLGRVTRTLNAVDHCSFTLNRGERLGIVGESGSGKSSLGMAVLHLIPSQGKLTFLGRDMHNLQPAELRALRKHLQVVFQDPYSSLNPRMNLEELIVEGIEAHAGHSLTAAEKKAAAERALASVELDPAWRVRYPHELSGGQRQRVAIARALALEPDLLVLDEPTSSLDRALQFQILRLLAERQAQNRTACIFITHDLRLVRSFCHKVLVLRQGKVMEYAPVETLFAAPRTEYTKILLGASAGVQV